ncbi:flagellar motor switch protein FliM [Pedomonas mirosovicensis]|uniref:flagellar motor switch protein FliM n=1 Tax=Pedomonas mirosovicensis TaxID=2908641 RepID=UPI002168676E|nr:flagellar motor switch protein FliM [Pedomonas mirosovicensis]MCH8685105.1 flagellar motor switch protein FliM [Pedomonas mirosovicensis]
MIDNDDISSDETGGPDDDALAAEWAAMAEEKPDDSDIAAEWEKMAEQEEEEILSSVQAGRVLDQDEIDSLLGFDGDDEETARTGIHAIINSSLVSYERLPMLDVIFDRLVRMMTTSLRNFTSDNIEVSLDNISSVRFGDYLNSVPLPAMMGVFQAVEWDNFGLMTVDSNLIYSIVDVLLGGRRGTAPMRIEGRPYTTIETNLVERMIDVILADMAQAFEPLSPVKFRFDRIETNPRFASIARPTNAAVVIRLRVDMEDRGGKLEMLFPYATLEPIRELLLQRFMGEKFGRDSIWETHLATELWRTRIELDAVLDEQTMLLSEVMNFKVGQTLVFNATAKDNVDLRCGDVSLLSGRLGRSGKKIAVQVRATNGKF